MALWSRYKLFVLEWRLYGTFGRYNRYRRVCLEQHAQTTGEKLRIAQGVLNGPGINTLEAQYNELYLQEHEHKEPSIVRPSRGVERPPTEIEPKRRKQA